MMTQEEFDDLTLLAEMWDIPVATAAYGIFADEMSRFRNEKPHSPENLVLAASRYIAKHVGDMNMTKHYPRSEFE